MRAVALDAHSLAGVSHTAVGPAGQRLPMMPAPLEDVAIVMIPGLGLQPRQEVGVILGVTP